MSNQLSPFGMAFAGAVGGVVANSIVIKTRIQTEVQAKKSEAGAAGASSPSALNRPGAPNRLPAASTSRSAGGAAIKAKGAREMLFKILKEGGVRALYRGFGASMLNTFSMQFAYFYWYTIVRRTYMKRFPSVAALNTTTELALGALAAAFAQLFTIPVSVIATRQQTSTKDQGFAATTRDILADDGITGLWRGLRPSLVLVVNPSITYGAFERLKTALLKPGEKMTPGKAFYVGALSKTLATVVTYPYIMAKTRLQAKYEDVDEPLLNEEASIGLPSKSTQHKKRKERYNGAVDCLRQVYKENGFAGWYQGMQAQITKAVLSQALLFGIKDAIEAYVALALLWYARKSGLAVGVKSV
ncbi:BQ5605_C004g02599 [Microbotryum silenes-dioicae]|uniref:BQ5605_C004g02599 protein n=1 Tax=Microbotryum silenes-dioicae TaxID=796604 RepID=A0A2X0MBI8_9BASI|nr:BQ5605_C004g02599 [Microbotryum silenes-dioicae]